VEVRGESASAGRQQILQNHCPGMGIKFIEKFYTGQFSASLPTEKSDKN
jgi:hypothetical protein